MAEAEVPRWYERFLDEERLKRFRHRLPLYRREEYYQEYDIVKVQYLLHLCPRSAETVEVEMLAKAYGFWPEQSFFYFQVDRRGAMSPRIRLTRPLIAIRGKKYPLIDGLHRLYKAAHTEQATLPCLFMSSDEAWLCRR